MVGAAQQQAAGLAGLHRVELPSQVFSEPGAVDNGRVTRGQEGDGLFIGGQVDHGARRHASIVVLGRAVAVARRQEPAQRPSAGQVATDEVLPRRPFVTEPRPSFAVAATRPDHVSMK